jgi:hypothetical protein
MAGEPLFFADAYGKIVAATQEPIARCQQQRHRCIVRHA